MDKTFNELFDEFFKRNNINPNDKLTDKTKDNAKKMLDLLTNPKNIEHIDEEVEKQIDLTLGTPDKVEFFNEGSIFFERKTWNTPTGDLIKLIVTDDPSLKIAPQPQNLQKEMEKAVENEEFEKAALIRDKIKKIKKEQKKAK